MSRGESVEWDGQLIRRNIDEWFEIGRRRGARFLLICQDTFDLSDPDMGLYPHYSPTIHEARAFAAHQLTGIDVLVEVLDLACDLDVQLSQPRKRDLEGLS